LIIYCALLDDAIRIPDFSAQLLHVCIILAISSIVFKTIANRFYADILSILNLLCGITGILLIFQGRYVYATIAILAGQIFDLFDGRMAEKHGGTKFGPWFDDIADLVSFGLCPAFFILMKGDLQLPAFVFGILYFLAIGFRLWRFLAHDKDDKTLPPGAFNGLPSPAGGRFPENPNGSLNDIAGICDASGRIFGLMPHPEAYNHWTNHPDWTRRKEISKRRGTGADEGLTVGVRLLKNGVDFIRENQ